MINLRSCSGLGLVVIAVLGCDSPRRVTATCANAERYHSNLGTVNIPLYTLGKVLMISGAPGATRATSILKLDVRDTDKTSGPVAEHMSATLDSKFHLAFEGEVPVAVKANAELTIGRAVGAELTNVRRVELKDVASLVNRSNEQLKITLKNAAADHSKQFVVVSSLKSADSLELKLSNETESKVGANVVKYGNVELEVTYRCDGIIKLAGHASDLGVFYGITPIRYVADMDKIIIDDVEVAIWNASHGNAMMEP